MARQSDPQLAASEAQMNAQAEGVMQSRAALLPQISADVTFNHSTTNSSGNQVLAGVPMPLNSTTSSRGRRSGIKLRQSIYDHSNYTQLAASKARARQASPNSIPPPTR